MGFNTVSPVVGYGDVVIVFLGHDSMFPLTVKKGEISQSKYGAIKHDLLAGHAYGTKFLCSRGWVYILQPTPELWTVTLPHRTQILYTADIAMITFQLELKPGSVVCESGTGSGSLSHAIIRTVAPTGHLHTVEFHEERFRKARDEFERHGLADHVTIYHRDVIKDGFPIENAADAVFLDIPRPDEAIPVAIKALKSSGGRLCSFSPCVEQVQRTCAVLRKPGSGFRDIETIEIVRKTQNVKRSSLPIADLGLGNSEVRASLLTPSSGARILPCAYEEGDELPIGDVTVRTNHDPTSSGAQANRNAKRQKLDEGAQEPKETGSGTSAGTEGKGRLLGKGGLEGKGYTPPAATKYAFSFRTCIPPKEIYGHTGYLTFASYCPEVISASCEAVGVQ